VTQAVIDVAADSGFGKLPKNAPGDRFSVSYSMWISFLLILAFPITGELDRTFNLYLGIVPIILFALATAAIVFFWSLIRNIVLRRWKRVASVVVAPFVAVVLLLAIRDLALIERARLETGMRAYVAEIEQLPRSDGLRFKTFDWGSTGGAAVVNIFYTLVYDESDEILLPPDRRTNAWRLNASSFCRYPHYCANYVSEDKNHALTVKRISGHFYSVTELYQ
jgi:hypothetical protein